MTFSLLDAYPSACLAFSLAGIGLLALVRAKYKEVRTIPGVELLLAGSAGN